MSEIVKAAFLISGKGTTAKAAIEEYKSHGLDGIVPALVVSNWNAPGIKIAEGLGVSTKIIPKKQISSWEFEQELLQTLEENKIDMIAQLGWMINTPDSILVKYSGFNQHPGPTPDFGGQGMYGTRVTAAVLAYAWLTGELTHTESTTHRIVHNVDEGEVIRVSPMKIPQEFLRRTDIETFKYDERVRNELKAATQIVKDLLLPLEHKNVIATLKDFGRKSVPVFRRKTPLVRPENLEILNQAKQLAIELYK